MQKKVMIIGAGALGKCLAALLAETAEVAVYDRDPVVCQQILANGLIFKEGPHTRKVRVMVVSSLKELRFKKIDVLIFATKVMDLPKAVRLASKLSPQCIFFPQNGFFDIGYIRSSFKDADICRGVTTMACQERPSGTAELFYRGSIYVGGAGAIKIKALFERANVQVKAYQDPQGLVLTKLIFSAIMNPLPVISAQGYDILNQDHKTFLLVSKAVMEGRAVARAMGVRLVFDPMTMILRVKEGDLAKMSYKGSMFQDFKMGRPTEIGHITGALIKIAHAHKVRVPALKSILRAAKLAGA